MLHIITALILGIVEGITEFLPISSTGHLILVNQFLSFDPAFTKLFDIIVQLGAVLAAVFYFREKIFPFLRPGTEIKETITLWKKILIGFFPTLVLGALFGSKIQDSLFNPIVVAIMLLVGGIIIILVERKERVATIPNIQNMSYGKAFLIGCCQCLALIPGTSRSAATIIGALLLGASRTAAIEFSFLIAIPTMVAASAYSLLKHVTPIDTYGFALLGIGFFTSFLVATGVIKVFMKYIQNKNFTAFGYYRIILAILIFGYFLFV